MREIPFVKMHGLGNDFILIESARLKGNEDLSQMAVALCRRHFSIGADGLIILYPPQRSDCALRWRIFNPDGSEAEMCGNGIRCLAVYAYRRGLVRERSFAVETLAGPIRPRVLEGDLVKVDMGRPALSRTLIPMAGSDTDRVMDEELVIGGRAFQITALSMGNPHCVIFVPEISEEEVRQYGPLIECCPAFPNRTNVEFAAVRSRTRVDAIVWERGVGITLACGTGACAVAVAAMMKGLMEPEVTVGLPGGELRIRWDGEGSPVFMTGPVATAFEGVVKLDEQELDAEGAEI